MTGLTQEEIYGRLANRVYIIRKAVPEDALGITIVNVYTWKTTYAGLMPDSLIDSRIDALVARAEKCKSDIMNARQVLVAAEGRTIIGFCAYGKSRNEEYGDSGEIYALYVLRGYQKAGIGKALFLAAANALADEGYGTMIINCLRNNPSVGFYRHMGGVVVGRRHDDINEAQIDEDILYYKSLIFPSADEAASR